MASASSFDARAQSSCAFPEPIPYAGLGSILFRFTFLIVSIPNVWQRPSSSVRDTSGAPIKRALILRFCSCSTSIILAGKDYYSELIKGISNYKLPLEGLPMGTRLQWLDEHTNSGTSENACLKIHKWVNTLPRLSWPFDVCDIPSNGVYMFFEKGEKYFGFDRIVRIGTHTGNNNLVKRLEEHLVKENKDRSIFRKNVGRALLNKENDPFIEKWNWDQTTPGNRSKYKWTLGDEMKQSDIEFSVSKYMRNNLSFVCIPIDSKEERLAYEAYLIRTLSAEPTFKPSENWLGNYSPVDKIRNSGLWLVNELAKHKSESVKVSKYKPLLSF